jgi:isocitrate dehydrogenase
VFGEIAAQLTENEAKIVEELNAAQGPAQELGGYFDPDPKLAAKAMRPSETFNKIIDSVG